MAKCYDCRTETGPNFVMDVRKVTDHHLLVTGDVGHNMMAVTQQSGGYTRVPVCADRKQCAKNVAAKNALVKKAVPTSVLGKIEQKVLADVNKVLSNIQVPTDR